MTTAERTARSVPRFVLPHLASRWGLVLAIGVSACDSSSSSNPAAGAPSSNAAGGKNSEQSGNAPAITSQPTDQEVVQGQTATFSVSVAGAGPFTYQWQKGGVNITGATSASYTTPVTTLADSDARFTVTVSSASGTVTTAAATLTVTATAMPPTITAQPMSQTVAVGQAATFSVVATGTSPLAYQWNKGGTAISGATSATYTLSATTLADSGTAYSVTVKNSLKSVTSDPATLTVTDGKGLFLNGFFLIGVFMPNMFDFTKWHGRGVNTGVGENIWLDPSTGNTTAGALQAWDKAAAAEGMRTIRRPMPTPKDDLGNTTLLGWSQMDEPDTTGAGLKNLPGCLSNYQQWKAVDPNRPVFLNFAGPDVATAIDGPKPDWCLESTGGCSLTSNHLDYINGALDWVANDIYPCSGYLPDNTRRCDPSYVGDPIDKIRSWTDKPTFAFVETSYQKFVPESTRGPTRDEVRAEIWVAIVHGVRGYIFFPQVVPADGVGNSNDGTPDDVAAELTTQNTTVAQLASVLQGDINPTTIGATVPAPLQAGWRDAPAGRYFFVVNTKKDTISGASIALKGLGTTTTLSVLNEARTVPLANGKLTDNFGPFAVHIYVAAK